MTAPQGDLPDLPPGVPALPGPAWWRRIEYVPLAIVTVLGIVAAGVGLTVQFQLSAAASQPASPTPDAGAIGSDYPTVCRNPVSSPDSEPWIDDDASAEAIWNGNADAAAAPVVLGEGGWAFWGDQVEENFSQSVGRRYLTVSEVDAWHDYFATLRDGLAGLGTDLYIVVSPSAGSVYADQLPEWVSGIRGSTPLDQFLAASPDLPIVDVRADLIEASQSAATYTPNNSHWTDFGGYVGWQTIARCGNAMYPDSASMWVPAISAVETTAEYNEFASYGVDDVGAQWTVPVYSEELSDVSVTSAGSTSTVPGDKALDLSLLPAETRVVDPSVRAGVGGGSALILRDSMGNALSTLWQQSFDQTWQLQHRYDDWSSPPNYAQLVEERNPDAVIVQFAERHLVNKPTTGPGF